jgi:Mn-dependent DtxR family transcriptional regulator
MIIQEAAEMYLETILVLEHRQGNVRSIDIAKEMGYSKPTISGQMKKFRENGYIEMDSNGHIHLTASGRKIAERIYERHNVIAQFLMGIGVDRETAYEDACRIEHYISQITFDHIKAYYNEKLNQK